MRNIPQNIADAALSKSKTINSRITIRDDRLLFTECSNALPAEQVLSAGWDTHDASAYDGGILRIATAGSQLKAQWVEDPDDVWPEWVTTELSVRLHCKPGVLGNRVWIVDNLGELRVLDYDTTAGEFTNTGTTLMIGLDDRYALAPISPTECYILQVRTNGNAIEDILYVSIDGLGVIDEQRSWGKLLHCISGDWKSFDAIRLNGIDYILHSNGGGRRAMCITATPGGHAFSDPQDIFPLDYADDISSLVIGGCISINNSLFVTGTLSRSASGSPMQIYTLGPDHFTAGRDMFIGPYGAQPFTKSIGGNDYSFAAGQGTPVQVGSRLYFILPGIIYRASLPSWLGGASPSWAYSCNQVRASYDRTGAATLTLEVPSNIDTSIRAGMTLILENYISNPVTGGGWFQLGEYEIDAIQIPKSAAGRSLSITARPKGIKRLSQWKSDASYDYWSQAARRSEAGDQRYNVRLSNFSTTENNGVHPTTKDKVSLLYSTENAAHSYIARCKTTIGGSVIYFGPVVSMYTETKAEAAGRLGVAIDEVAADQVVTRGICLIYHNSGTPYFSLRHLDTGKAWTASGIANCPWTEIAASDPITLDEAEYDFMIVYAHGRIDAYYKKSTDIIWLRALDPAFFDLEGENGFIMPSSRTDIRSRVGLFSRTELGRTTAITSAPYSFAPQNIDALNSDVYTLNPPVGGVSTLIPLGGSEAAKNRNKSDDWLSPWWYFPLGKVRQWSGVEQPWDNPEKDIAYWLNNYNYAVTLCPISDKWPDTYDPEYLTGCMLMVIAGPANVGKSFEIRKVDWDAPYNWCGSRSLSTQEWMNHPGDPYWGYWSKDHRMMYNSSTGIYEARAANSRYMRVVPTWYEPWMLSMAPEFAYYTETWDYQLKIIPGIRLTSTGYELTTMLTNNGLANKVIEDAPPEHPVTLELTAASGDIDIPFEWMATEIARKAGVLSVDVPGEISSFSHTTDGWDLDEDGANQVERVKTGIVRLKIQEEEIGVMAAEGGGILGGLWNGEIVTANTSCIRRYICTDGTITLAEQFELDQYLSGGFWATISFDKDKASVWINNSLAATFMIDTEVNSLMIVSPEISATDVAWSTLDMRVDNFVLDIGQSGIDLLRRLIKRKRIRFGDNGTGGIKVFRDGEVVNSELAPYDLTVTSVDTDTDINRVTRVRLEGVDVHEAASEGGLTEYGNVFAVENFDEFDYHEQFVREGGLYLEDIERSGNSRTYRGGVDPRIEPWDKIWINDGGTVKQVLVNSIQHNLSISEDGAIYDMEIEAEEI